MTSEVYSEGTKETQGHPTDGRVGVSTLIFMFSVANRSCAVGPTASTLKPAHYPTSAVGVSTPTGSLENRHNHLKDTLWVLTGGFCP